MLQRCPSWIRSPIRRWIRPGDKYAFLCQLRPNAEILDVGCGNNSPSVTKGILPSCVYTGIDIGEYNQTVPNMADKYIIVSPETFAEEIDRFKECFDAVISSHNLEHCNDREKTIRAMLGAVKRNGQTFFSFPSADSVNFPRRGGVLNYYDDPTHKGLPPAFAQLTNTLESNGFEIEYAIKKHQPLPDRIHGLINEPRSRKLNTIMAGTWEYYGFESIIWARRIG